MTHTKVAFRQYSKPIVTVVDGSATSPDGDFNVLRLTTDDPIAYPGAAAVIQAAIDSIKTTTGGTIRIKSGIYALETEVDFTGSTKPIRIVGDGSTGTYMVHPQDNQTILNVGDPGAVTLSISTVALTSITYTRSSGSWARIPSPGEVVYISSGSIDARNEGYFSVRSCTSTVLVVTPRVTGGTGFAQPGPLAIGSVTDMTRVSHSFMVSENIQNISFEQMEFTRSAGSYGSHIFVDQGADHISIEDNTLHGVPTAFGCDVLVSGFTAIQDVVVARNQFVDASDCIEGRSVAIQMFGTVKDVAIEDNYLSHLRTIFIRANDWPSDATKVGSRISIARNRLVADVAPAALAWPVGTSIGGIWVEGVHNFVTLDSNTIEASINHSNVAFSGIELREGGSTMAADFNAFDKVIHNNVYLVVAGGVGNANNIPFVADYNYSTNNRFCAKRIDISGNHFRKDQTGSAENNYALVIRNVAYGSFCKNSVGAYGSVYFWKIHDFAIGDNTSDATIDGYSIQDSSSFTFTGNMVYSSGGDGIEILATAVVPAFECRYFNIEGNVFYATAGDGIRISGTPTNYTLGSNAMFGGVETSNVLSPAANGHTDLGTSTKTFKDLHVQNVKANDYLYLDGGDNTYLREDSADQIHFIAGGVDILAIGSGDEIWSTPDEDADDSFYINRVGFAGGTTRFRDTFIGTGKNTTIARFIASTQSLKVEGGIAAGAASYLKWKILTGTFEVAGYDFTDEFWAGAQTTKRLSHNLSGANIISVLGSIRPDANVVAMADKGTNYVDTNDTECFACWDDDYVYIAIGNAHYQGANPCQIIVFYM